MSVRPFHHQRPLACAALAFGLGIGAGVSFAWRPALYALGLAAAAVATALLPRIGGKRAVGAMACFLFLGALLGGWHSHPALPEEGKYRVTGVLSCDAALRENGTAAAYLENAVIETEEGPARLGRLYWTYTPDAEQPFLPCEGDRVSFEGRLYHPQGRVNPHGFDFRMYLLQRGVPAGVSGARETELLGHPGRGVFSVFYHLKQHLTARVRLIFGEDSALPEALLLGQREQLPEETLKGFSDAGAAHLLAVSGLHVGLLAGLLMVPLRRFCGPKARLYVLGAFLLAYCALLDFAAPVVRASILLLLAAWRRVIRRAPDHLTTLSAAFLFILLFRPLDLFSASFQLSFCAVLGIVTFGGSLPDPGSRGPGQAILSAWRVTAAATAGVALPTIQIFHRLSLIGLFVNPLACALFSLLLPAYLLITTVGCVWLRGGLWLAAFINPVTRGVIAAVTWLGKLPFASFRVPSLPWYCVLAVILALALTTRYVVFSQKKKLACALMALALSFGAWRLTLCRDVQFIQLSAGQADAAILTDGSETVLIDTGDYGGDTAAYLLSTGRQADRLILTHLHKDHCLGVERLLEEDIPIGAVYLPEGAEEQQIDEQCLALLDALKARGVPIIHFAAGDALRLSRCVLTAAWPLPGTVRPGQDANRYSLCLMCELDGIRLLSCADIPGDYEAYAARRADILKIAHHGSKDSTGTDFLKAVSPRAAIVTASRANSRLPNPETVKRIQAENAVLYHTGKTGAVTVTVRDSKAAVTTFLNEKEQP